MYGRFDAAFLASSYVERGRQTLSRIEQQRFRKTSDKVLNPGPNFDEWLEETLQKIPLTQSAAAGLKRRRAERMDTAVRMSFGSSLSPDERAPFLWEDELFMRSLSPRELRRLDTQFPPCPGCRDD